MSWSSTGWALVIEDTTNPNADAIYINDINSGVANGVTLMDFVVTGALEVAGLT